jgi:hypothetical protein
MTREDVIMMADASAFHTLVQEGELMRFAELVAKAERHRICDMLLDMHAKEERHNYYLFIANIIKESA